MVQEDLCEDEAPQRRFRGASESYTPPHMDGPDVSLPHCQLPATLGKLLRKDKNLAHKDLRHA